MFPAGLRRVSVNAFGYGGSNTHVILDDALYYLRDNGLKGNHRTIKAPSVTRHDNEHVEGHANGRTNRHTNGHTNGHTNRHTNGHTNGHTNRQINESSESNTGKVAQRIFVWSTTDEAGLKRLSNVYSEYLVDNQLTNIENKSGFLDDLAYTLSEKRTSWPWKSFAIADSLSSLTASLQSGLPKFVRLSKTIKLGLVFTSQGAQWPEMGKELLAYLVFEQQIKDADTYLKSLGCTWSLIGQYSYIDPSNVNFSNWY